MKRWRGYWDRKTVQYVSPDYARVDEIRRRHLERLKVYVEAHGFLCQECGGAGGETEYVDEYGGPWVTCGWCEGTGLVTRWGRGFWLACKKAEKKERVG